MWRRSRLRRLAWLLVVVLAVATGCSLGQPPPDPVSRYEPPRRDHCEQLRPDEVATQFGLSPRADRRVSGTYHEALRGAIIEWAIYCRFVVGVDDGQFAANAVTFEPIFGVKLVVYREPEQARRAFDGQAAEFSGITPGPDHSQPGVIWDLQPGTVEDGWWDGAAYLERMIAVSPHDSTRSDLLLDYTLLHDNLYISHAQLGAAFPSEDRDEVVALMHELILALIEEAVSHLTVTTDPWPSPLSPAPGG